MGTPTKSSGWYACACGRRPPNRAVPRRGRVLEKWALGLIGAEATSHLDAVNEQQIREALDRLMAGRTTVVIAHRLSTVRDADRIVVLESGQVVEEGDHQELLSKGGTYARLVSTQLVSASAQSPPGD